MYLPFILLCCYYTFNVSHRQTLFAIFVLHLLYVCFIFVYSKTYITTENFDTMTTKEQFGSQIKKNREKKHFTVRQTALQGGFSSAYLSQIENGNKNIPKVETLYKIAKGLRLSKNDILALAGITEPEKKPLKDKIDLGEQLENSELLLSFEGKELSPEYRHAILSILKTLPDADSTSSKN